MAPIIALEGTHCSGKTKLLNKLAKKFNDMGYKVEVVPEIARIAKDKGYGLNESHSYETTMFIIREQLKYEELAKKKNPDLILCDRSVLSALAYAENSNVNNLEDIRELLNGMDLETRYDLVLFLDKLPVVIQDEYRTNPSKPFQRNIEKILKRLVKEYNLPVKKLKFQNNIYYYGRLDKSIEEIKKLLTP